MANPNSTNYETECIHSSSESDLDSCEEQFDDLEMDDLLDILHSSISEGC